MSHRNKSTYLVTDVTINDFANAPKITNKRKKVTRFSEDVIADCWETVDDVEFDFVEDINEDNVITSHINKRKRNSTLFKDHSKIQEQPGIEYPEIVWYLISFYIKPEDIGRFSCINKTTYKLTKREAFWKNIYNQYCKSSKNLPEKLKLEKGLRCHGLKQRVVRGLFISYNLFVETIMQKDLQPSKINSLVKMRCYGIWYKESDTCWLVFFKFKTNQWNNYHKKRALIDILGDIDANSEENCKILQVTCKSICNIPPLMGMTLCSTAVYLSQGFRHQTVHLGFTSSPHTATSKHVAEYMVSLDNVCCFDILDWWHPRYPLAGNAILKDEENNPVLEEDFHAMKI